MIRKRLHLFVQGLLGFSIVAGFILMPILSAIILAAAVGGMDAAYYSKLYNRVQRFLDHLRKHTDA